MCEKKEELGRIRDLELKLIVLKEMWEMEK